MHNSPIPELSAQQISRILRNVAAESNNGCQLWTRAVNSRGYGHVHLAQGMFNVARIIYKIRYGVDPSDQCVLHRCDNPPCVNPAHLFLGTKKENTADMILKGRKRGPRGSSHKSAKFSDEQILQIRTLYSQGWTRKNLAESFGVTRPTIAAIVKRMSWKHV